MAEPASSPSQSDSDDEARAVNDLEVIMDEVEDGRSTILTNPLMKTKRKEAAIVIQRVWKRYRKHLRVLKVRNKWRYSFQVASDVRKKNSSSALLAVIFTVQLLVYFVNLFWGIYVKDTFALLGFYATILVWAITLPLKSSWQTKAALFFSALSYIYVSVIVKASSNKTYGAEYWLSKITLMVLIPCLYFLLEYMAKILRHTYSGGLGIHQLSERITAEVLGVFAVIFYFATSEVAIEMSIEIFIADLCHYMPGAYYDKNYKEDAQSLATGSWRNCTESAKFDEYFPEHPKTVEEVMLQQGMKEYFGMKLEQKIARYHLVEAVVVLITTQVLFRICRLNLSSLISLQVSAWECLLGVITIIRVGASFVLGSMSLEKSKMSQLQVMLRVLEGVIWFGHISALIVVSKLLYDADKLIRIEEGNQKNNKHSVPKNWKRLSKSKSMRVISKRKQRKSVRASLK